MGNILFQVLRHFINFFFLSFLLPSQEKSQRKIIHLNVLRDETAGKLKMLIFSHVDELDKR